MIKKSNKTYNIILYGIGGQGTLKASEICAQAAFLEGYHVKKSEVHGMAQRGGSVESHLRFGKLVYAPLVPEFQADVLVCFYEGEHERLKHFLKKGGIDLISYLPQAEEFLKDNRRYLNTFMLGVLSCFIPISERCWLEAIDTVLAGKNTQKNKNIFLQARKIGGAR